MLVAQEGINGAVCGRKEAIEQLKAELKQDCRFRDLTFREQEAEKQTYHKLIVRVRKEMVVFGHPVDLKKTGTYLSPQELKKWYDEKKDFVIIDARNDYEYTVGKFKNAVTLAIHNFREFPCAVDKIQQLKNKKIVTYCTGGVRCEKASAYLREQGFKEVYQLQGGIINYENQLPHTNFEGSCFVFDDRKVAQGGEAISTCVHCGELSDAIINCHNLDCDILFVSCERCQKKMNGCCSTECQKAPRQRKSLDGSQHSSVQNKIETEIAGIVENYYARAQVALIKVTAHLSQNSTVVFAGKTTKEFAQKVKELRNEEGNSISEAQPGERITVHIPYKLRKNDMVFLSE